LYSFCMTSEHPNGKVGKSLVASESAQTERRFNSQTD
jgi:hypothetical protein